MITRLPQTAPGRVPRPPITAAVSSAIESVIVKAPGATSSVTMASSAPAIPAQVALTTKASTRARATFTPASAAATSSSRTARQLRPTLLRLRFASSTRVISATAEQTQACHLVNGKFTPRKPGVVKTTFSPWSPPKVPGYAYATEGSATLSSSVAPARYGPRSLAAATPTTAPATAVATAGDTSAATNGSQVRCSSSSAVV